MRFWMKYWFLLILGALVLGSNDSLAQEDISAKLDSLEAHVLEGQKDSLLYTTLLALTDIKTFTNSDSAIAYAWELIALADRMGDLPQRISSRCVLSGIYFHVGMIDSVEQVTLRAIAVAEACEEEACWVEKINALKALRVPLRHRGAVKEIVNNWEAFLAIPNLPGSVEFEIRRLMSYPLLEMGDEYRALKELSMVWEYGQEVGDDALLCNALGELAGAYDVMGQKDRALEVAQERLRICQRISNFYATRHAHNQLGHAFIDVAQYDSAVWHLEQVLNMSKADDFIYPYALGGLIAIAGEIDSKQAITSVQEMERLVRQRESEGNPEMHSRQYMYGTLSRYYLGAKNFATAQRYAAKRLDWVRQYHSDTTDLAVDALELLAKTQAAGGKYAAAWDNYTAFHELRMTMINRNKEEALARTAVELELAENELARQVAEQTTALERQASTARTRLFLTIFGVGAIVLLIMLWAYRRAQIDRKIIREKNQQIEQSLAEKEVLLREIHHRVKNNLQIISSLLDKQARKSSDEAVRQLVREGQERIQSMALIHQNLYESDQLSGIDIKSYLRELTTNIQHSQVAKKQEDQIELELNVADEHLDIDTAIPVGLILNELLTNCYKYAFQGRSAGKINVAFHKEAEQYHLRVSDNGVGFRPNKSETGKRSLGLSLVRGLVRQLDGTIEWLKVDQGTAVVITF